MSPAGGKRAGAGRPAFLAVPVRFTLMIEESYLSQALVIAQERDVHVSTVVREALAEYLARQSKPKRRRADQSRGE